MAMLRFDEQTGQLVAPGTSEIREMVANDWIAAFNTGDGSPALDTEAATPAGQLIDAITAYIAQANAELLYLANQFNPLTAEGAFQDALGAIYFLTRKTAQPTSVICTCTGLQGTVIPAGAQVQDVNGNKYQSVAAVTIPVSGAVNATFTALEAGALECPASSVTRIITVVAGWDTVNNPASGVTGRVQESQSDFEKRRFLSVAQNAQGSVLALQGALDNIDGVVDCLVLENATSESVMQGGITIPAHSVAISIFGGDDNEIAETIYRKKSAGCGTTGDTVVTYSAENDITYSFNIIRPQTIDIKIVINVDYLLSLSASFIDDIKNAIISDFNGENADSGNTRVGMGEIVYASRFSTAVLITAGVRSLRNITIAIADGSPDNFIDIPVNVQPVISASDITVNSITE